MAAGKPRGHRRILDEPTQSDATLLLKVEDLINIAMGPSDQNIVNFKLIQQILFIMARQMRLLETKVELRVGELENQASQFITRMSMMPQGGHEQSTSSEESMQYGAQGGWDQDQGGGQGAGGGGREGRGRKEKGPRGGGGGGYDGGGGGGPGGGRRGPPGGPQDAEWDEYEEGAGGGPTGRGKKGRKGAAGGQQAEWGPEYQSAPPGGWGPEGPPPGWVGPEYQQAPPGGWGPKGPPPGWVGPEHQPAPPGGWGPKGAPRGWVGPEYQPTPPGGWGPKGPPPGWVGPEHKPAPPGGWGPKGPPPGWVGPQYQPAPPGGWGPNGPPPGWVAPEHQPAPPGGWGPKGPPPGWVGPEYQPAPPGGWGPQGPPPGWVGPKYQSAPAGGWGPEGPPKGWVGPGGQQGAPGGKGPAGAPGAGGGGFEGGRRPSGTSIAVSERTDGKDKVLVVGKGERREEPGGGGRQRVGSIEVVTAREFAVLEAAVKALQEKGSLPPPPKLPDNQKLRSDIERGSATLIDTMNAMQLGARVQAAEKAIGNMAELLTALAATGALPPEVAQRAAAIQGDVQAMRRDMEAMGQGPGSARGVPGAAAAPRYPGGGPGGYAGGPGGGPWAGGPGGVPGGPGTYAGAPQGAGGPGMVDGGPGGAEQPGLDLQGPSAISRGPGQGPPGTQPSVFSQKLGTTGTATPAQMTTVTHADLDGAMAYLRDEIVNNMKAMTQRANTTAESAATAIKAIAEKMDMASSIDTRLTFLQAMVNDYSEQLAGFDTGLSTQMTSFQDQMVTMRAELQAGLTQLEQVNNNAETAAILELNERYEELVNELDNTLHSHQGLTTFQRQLTDELKSLVEAVEMMREQKADRDEVLDGLRDKADMSRLQGLLSEADFQEAREQLEMRIQMCYDKFRRQDAVWMNVMNDFGEIIESKAELTQLLGVREETQDQLQDLHWKVQQLAKLLGDPKAAVVIRKLAKDATCAVCRAPALMEQIEPLQPVALPPARPPLPPFEEGKPCMRYFDLKDLIGPEVPRLEPHLCNRWVGGSHTLIGAAPGMGSVAREVAPQTGSARPVKQYLGQGTDGKLYKLEEDLMPCVECNQFAPEKAEEKIPGEAEVPSIQDGSGDQGPQMSHVTVVDPSTAARRVTVVDDANIRRAVDMTEVNKRGEGDDVTAHHSILNARRSSISARRSQTVAGDDDDEHFPKMNVRVSKIDRNTVILENEAAARDVEVGQSMHGRVTLKDAQDAEMSAIKQQIEDDRAVKAAASRAVMEVPEGAGEGPEQGAGEGQERGAGEGAPLPPEKTLSATQPPPPPPEAGEAPPPLETEAPPPADAPAPEQAASEPPVEEAPPTEG